MSSELIYKQKKGAGLKTAIHCAFSRGGVPLLR